MDAIAQILCGHDSFQFLHHTANSTVPHVSECAQTTVLALFPCFFLIFFCPMVLYSLSKSDNGHLECCSPILARIAIGGLLSCCTAIVLFYGFYEWSIAKVQFEGWPLFTPTVQYLAICVALVLMIACRNRGVISSGVLFNFWLLLAICGFPEFRWRLATMSSYQEEDFDRVRFIIYMIFYPLVILQLILSCFADTPMYKINDKSICPEESSSFLNQVTFNWFHGLAVKGNKRALQISDLWKLNSRDQSKNLVPQFNKRWIPALQAYLERKKAALQEAVPRVLTEKDMPSVLWPLFKTFRLEFLGGAALKFIFDLLQFVAPQLLKLLISFIEDKQSPLWIGVAISLLMFFVSLFQSMILHQYFHTMFSLGMNVRSVLTSAVYSKALSLSNSARKNRTVGEIVNLMSVDIQRFQDMTSFVMLFWSAPLQVILSIYFLWRLLGVSVIAGLFILIAMVPFNSWISIKMRNCQVEQMKYKDERLKLMSEILYGMKVLKLYAWESSMQKMVMDIRQKELKVLRRLAYYNAATTLSWSCAPFLVAVLTFGLYVNLGSGNVLTPQVTFVGLSLFNILRFPLAVFAMIFSQAVQCVVSNKRLKSFLSDDEMENFVEDGSSSYGAAVIHDGTFSWDSSEVTLKDINVNIKKGQLVAIVGKVGSGKSSLLSALLGEMDKQKGRVMLSGSVAYVPQQPWIQNMTLRDNIIFNKNFSFDTYQRVIEACALQPDLETLPAADNTEIGEKGINLSGGQKQRVSLARAVYADADIVLLDDPLSAVDAHVGKHIFDYVLSSKTGMLAGKTRILVTHALHFLKYCDQVIVVKDKTISEMGTYEELMASEGAFAEFLEEFLVEEAKNRARSVSFGEQAEEVSEVLKELERFDPAKRRRIESQLSQATHSSQESLERTDRSPSPVARQKSPVDASPSPQIGNGNASAEKGGERRRMTGDGKDEIEPLIKKDGKAAPPSNNEKSKLIEKEAVEIGKVKWTVYATYIRAIGYFITFVFITIYIFSSALGVMSNLWLARWSDHAKDVNASAGEDDTNLRLSIYAALGMGQAIFVCVASVTMALGMVYASRFLHEGILRNILHSPMSFFDVTPLGRILNRFGKDVETLDARLPFSLMTMIGSIVQALCTIIIPVLVTPIVIFFFVCLSVVYIFLLRFYVSTSRQLKRLESVTRSPIYSHFQESVQGAACIRAYHCVDRFIGESQKRVDDNLVTYYPSIVANRWLAVRLELIGNLIVLFSALFAAMFRDSVTAGLVGLSVSYALNITQTLNWAVRMTSELETNIVAVERLKEYTETPTEGAKDEGLLKKPPRDWPARGEIQIDNLKLRYRENLDFVLRGVTAHIKSGEKVGIIGRTGAGKSSLTLALFRIVEADAGRILIDGLDISLLPLEQLRSKLTIVPQDPVLFSGTLRMNIDPFERFSDATVWDALKLAHLEPFVSSLVDRLEHRIAEGGENLSVGQRQLVCLARALLRKTSILILDEAAASVDMETDALIQKTIREQFANCTVLTIAHRLHTVIDNDRLLVLENGKVKEFDAPAKLLEDKTSLFYSMAKESGLTQ